ncbi:MAG: hypothetical protein IK099_07830 [Clostridia bacterium]|nr:hypothetical protein [Clostridia bacterium]
MAAIAVWQAKPFFPEISSTLILPYIDKKTDMTYYDDSLYPPLENVPRRYAISKRNEWMVDAADIIVAYVLHGWGGAAKTLAYAKKRGKTMISYVEKDRISMNLEDK